MTDVATQVADSYGRMETGTVKETAGLSWPQRLLIVLLVGDGLFILAHLLLVFTPLITNNSFYLDVDGSYGEWFQYVKYGTIIGLLLPLFRQQRAPLHLFWMALFAYLLLDDALQIHEQVGLWLAETAGLPAILTLRPRDLGELGFSALAALFFLTILVLSYQLSHSQSRDFSQWLLLLMFGLAFVGVALDLVHEATWRLLPNLPFLGELLIVVEDGGEMVMVSLMLWLVFRQAGWANGWTVAQMGSWVREAAMVLALTGIVTAVLAFIQFSSPALVGNDGYYHAKMGLLLRQGGLAAARPELPLTVLQGENFYNHHLLYHHYLCRNHSEARSGEFEK